jgi:TonB family protein
MRCWISFPAVLMLACTSVSYAHLHNASGLPLAVWCGTPLPPDQSRISDTELLKRRLQGPMPEYPVAAQKSGIQGEVLLFAVVSPSGNVDHLKVIEGNPLLAEAATRAVRGWKFSPLMVHNAPAEVGGTVVLSFHLGKKPSVTDGKPLRLPEALCGGVMPGPQRKHDVQPVYPETARIAHIQGDVVLRAIIDKNGNVAEARVVSGHPLLINAAMDAVKQWVYQPFVFNGKPVAVDTVITVKFHM